MATLYYKVIAVQDDGTEVEVPDFRLLPYVPDVVEPPPEPEDPPIAAIVIAKPSLTVRSSAKVATDPSNKIGTFPTKAQFWVSAQTFATDGNDWIWRQVVKINGENDIRVGGYVAEVMRDGTNRLLDLDEHEPVSDLLYPVVERQYDAKTFYSVQIDGNNSRQQIGVNMRRAVWMTDGNGAVIDSQLAENGVNRVRLIEELNRINKPKWSDHEPYYGHLIRSILKNSKYSTAQTIANAKEYLSILNQYRDENGVPYLRAVFCLVDTFNAYPNMVFKEYVELGYHDGPQGKTGSRFWTDRAWNTHLTNFIVEVVPALTDAYPDLIFGWQIMNEPALTEPATNAAIQAYIEGAKTLARMIWTACDGKHHIMTGLRTGHDISQGLITTEQFYDQLLSGDGKYITMLNHHPYCKRPPIKSTIPTDLLEEWEFMKQDNDAARKHKRPIMADEMGTYLEGYSPTDVLQRDEAETAALEYLQWELGEYACLEWNQMLTVTYDNGTGGSERGLSVVYQKNGQQIAVNTTQGVVKALHDHAQENYKRG